MLRRMMSSGVGRRPLPARRPASASRRKTEKRDALEVAPEAPAPAEYSQAPAEIPRPPTMGQELKSSFLWGIGMAFGFSMLGVVARVFMEEAPNDEPLHTSSTM
ncbi:hypothetical protein SPRG_20202 [Saprolegnia parasitica CBS 223.65]|uniref:Uncharacterized protein n=1 Tax=Saprolegnia parasitica (strain CBS 223.65) TaxID=695850 RepID=A0A067CNB3_SAPPC|nr:hypothetical protein SPRG_20202 [Saprolegnia parasitica CBS 223.65]KDO28041.1 hypothetical protein SPRG_20202 [Saprolegnia parasitica CBS 223.65]|eukprot:XP_012201193.1 hypothetical protein SPRG_20202 [Saprolegnia parasitica CBS 223.65]